MKGKCKLSVKSMVSTRRDIRRERGFLVNDNDDVGDIFEIEAELARMRNMTAEEAAAHAAQVVAEADAALAAAEEAMREAEAAEADAQVAAAVATLMALRGRNNFDDTERKERRNNFGDTERRNFDDTERRKN